MALHPEFPKSPHVDVDPNVRWFPTDEAVRDTTLHKQDEVKVTQKFGNIFLTNIHRVYNRA